MPTNKHLQITMALFLCIWHAVVAASIIVAFPQGFAPWWGVGIYLIGQWWLTFRAAFAKTENGVWLWIAVMILNSLASFGTFHWFPHNWLVTLVPPSILALIAGYYAMAAIVAIWNLTKASASRIRRALS